MRKRVIAASAAAATAAALAVAPLAPASAVDPLYQLQVLHFYGESGLLGVDTAPRLASLVDKFEDAYPNTITLAEGDTWIPGPWLVGGADPTLNDVPGIGSTALGRPDVAIMNAIGVDASSLGNHEYDLGSPVVQAAITPSAPWVGAQFPFVTANLSFAGDSSLKPRADASIGGTGGALAGAETSTLVGRIVPSAVTTVNGEKIGIVGATTYELLSKTSPNGTTVVGVASTDDAVKIPELAGLVQARVDALTATGVNKIIMVDQLDTVERNKLLAPLLHGVDIMVAGGGHERLGDATDTAVGFNGHSADFVDTYPLLATDADGHPTLIVTTDTEYTYLGRLVVGFDTAGVIATSSLDPSINGAYAATEANLQAAYGTTDPEATIIASSTRGSAVKAITSAINNIIIAKDGNVFGYSGVYLEGDRVFTRAQETNLGDITADANAAVARTLLGSPQVVSLKNGGGLRASIGAIDEDGNKVGNVSTPVKPTNGISQLDVENALRFDNKLMVFDTTPAGLLAILNYAASLTPGNGGFAQLGGIRYSYNPTLPVGSRVRNVALFDGAGNEQAKVVSDGAVLPGAPATINMIALNFNANGGDGYPMKANADNFRFVTTGGVLSAPVSEALDFTSNAAFASVGITSADLLGEQKVFEDYLASQHSTPGAAYAQADTPASQDLRIQNLSLRDDAVFAPDVAAPSFTSVTVDCRSSATLTGIEFTDSGASSSPWTVTVDWGDGTTTSWTTATTGVQPDRSHTYTAAGSYAPVVTVSDATGVTGRATTGTPLVVAQTYTVGFLGPIEGSRSSDVEINSVKARRTVPVKVTLYDVCAQAYMTDPSADVSLVAGLASAGPATTAGSTRMRWVPSPDVPGEGYWQYNLTSRTGTGAPLAAGSVYRLDVFVDDVRATRYQWALLLVKR